MRNDHLLTTDQGEPRVHSPLYWTLADSLVLAKRQLMHIPRIPDELVTATAQPALILILFRYVFGGAIAVTGASYVNYLVAGILVMGAILGSSVTGVGVATDLQRGLVDRFRSLPMAKSAVLMGRTLADLIRSAFIILVVWVVGLLIGFRPEGTVLDCLAAMCLLLFSSFMFSWLSALLGLMLSVEAVPPAVALWSSVLLFASSAFAPTSTMPALLRTFAEHQPVSLLINAVRGLVLNKPDIPAIWQAIAWCVGLLVVFIPLSVWAYGRRTAR